MNKTKNVKLRAFTISQQQTLLSRSANIVEELKGKLEGSVAGDRKLKRSREEDDKEYDLISSYVTDKDTVFGVMLRVELDAFGREVPDDLFDKQAFSMSELPKEQNERNIYKNHYYFCLNKNRLVVTLPGNATITGLQTYVNWLLDSASAPFSMTPLCKAPPNVNLSELESITFADDFSVRYLEQETPRDSEEKTGSRLIDLAASEIKRLLNDTVDLSEEEFKRIVSAKLLLKLRKPAGMTEEDYQRRFGAVLKPIADMSNVSYKTKKGQTVKAEEITVTKTVQIELTDKGFPADEQLRQEMIAFLNEQATP